MAVFVLSADESKQLVTAWEKHLSATERSSWVNRVTRKVTPFFPSTIWIISVGTFLFCISKTSKFSSMRSPLFFVLVYKTQFYMPKMTISILLWEHKQILAIKEIGMGGGRGWVNPLIKVTFMKFITFKNIHYSVE